MRKTIHTFLLTWSFLALFTMCKNPGIDYKTFSIIEETVQPGLQSVLVLGKYDFLGEVLSMNLNIGLDEQLTDAKSYPMDLENQSFTVTVEGLAPGTSYYYCYVVEFDNTHKILTEIGTFTTLSDVPLVRTLDVTAVDSITFLVKCIVENDFGMPIIERGICWGLTSNPTCDNNIVEHPESDTGEYYCQITGLELNSYYFVRAYARNEMGLSYANEVLGFMTEAFEPPTVETLSVEEITPTSAICRGRIVNEGSSSVNQRYGIHLGTTLDFSVDGAYYQGDSDGDSFYVNFTDLSPNTIYYYRAYANNNEAIGYGDTHDFTTPSLGRFRIDVLCSPSDGGEASGSGEYDYNQSCELRATPNIGYYFKNWTDPAGNFLSEDNPYIITVINDMQLVANFTQAPEGGIDALFSVGPSSKIYFSRGNLQYRASDHTFQFAEDQWVRIGANNSNISSNYAGWIDLFGWGTGNEPTNTGTNNDFVDWGENSIENGGNKPGIWRTMTKEEWNYVMNNRETSTIGGVENARYAKAKVNNVRGIVLFPDTYENPNEIEIQTITINNPNGSFDDNVYSENQWSILEEKGCVFLPVTGNREETTVQYLDNGFYWSSSMFGMARSAYGLHFDESSLQTDVETALKIGESVRLVHEYQDANMRK